MNWTILMAGASLVFSAIGVVFMYPSFRNELKKLKQDRDTDKRTGNGTNSGGKLQKAKIFIQNHKTIICMILIFVILLSNSILLVLIFKKSVLPTEEPIIIEPYYESATGGTFYPIDEPGIADSKFYDSEGQLIGYCKNYPHYETIIASNIEYFYDKNDNLISSSFYNYDFKYNQNWYEDNKLILDAMYGPYPSPSGKNSDASYGPLEIQNQRTGIELSEGFDDESHIMGMAIANRHPYYETSNFYDIGNSKAMRVYFRDYYVQDELMPYKVEWINANDEVTSVVDVDKVSDYQYREHFYKCNSFGAKCYLNSATILFDEKNQVISETFEFDHDQPSQEILVDYSKSEAYSIASNGESICIKCELPEEYLEDSGFESKVFKVDIDELGFDIDSMQIKCTADTNPPEIAFEQNIGKSSLICLSNDANLSLIIKGNINNNNKETDNASLKIQVSEMLSDLIYTGENMIIDLEKDSPDEEYFAAYSIKPKWETDAPASLAKSVVIDIQ